MNKNLKKQILSYDILGKSRYNEYVYMNYQYVTREEEEKALIELKTVYITNDLIEKDIRLAEPWILMVKKKKQLMYMLRRELWFNVFEKKDINLAKKIQPIASFKEKDFLLFLEGYNKFDYLFFKKLIKNKIDFNLRDRIYDFSKNITVCGDKTKIRYKKIDLVELFLEKRSLQSYIEKSLFNLNKPHYGLSYIKKNILFFYKNFEFSTKEKRKHLNLVLSFINNCDIDNVFYQSLDLIQIFDLPKKKMIKILEKNLNKNNFDHFSKKLMLKDLELI